MIASRLANFGTTIFTEMSALAEKTGAINLGQGFPDEDGPQAVLEAAQAAIRNGRNQYAPLPGVPALREAIAEHQQRFYGIELDPASEVQVTMGATEAIAAAILGLCEPGDDVLAFDPYYDSYPAAAAMAGARFVPIPLQPPEFTFEDFVVPPKARVIIVNSPHNPTGRVFSREELQRIADLVIEHDLIAITDEVYEHLVFDGLEHIPLSTLPGMAERTLSISSPRQDVQRHGLEGRLGDGPAAARRRGPGGQAVPDVRGRDAVPARRGGRAAARRRLVPRVRGGARRPSATTCATPSATSRWPARRARTSPTWTSGTNAVEFARELPYKAGVVAIPTSVFSADPQRLAPYLRFAFCKRLPVIDEAARRLHALES